MTDIFANVKQRVDILQVAEVYGISVNSHKKALCPFHNDRHPSLSFKDDYYTCFACGAHGDVLNLVCGITNCTVIEAAKQLNDVFHLGLSVEKPNVEETAELQNGQHRVVLFRAWEQRAFISTNNYAKHLLKIILTRKPNCPEDILDPLYVQALQEWEFVNYLLDIFTFGDWPEKVACFKHYKKEVDRYEQCINSVAVK